jgi:hypothetical protein
MPSCRQNSATVSFVRSYRRSRRVHSATFPPLVSALIEWDPFAQFRRNPNFNRPVYNGSGGRLRLRAGELLPLHLAELEVSGPALVTAIEACPPIASGAGSVVTARFVTREVHRLVSVDLLGAGGELETLTGTPVHPVWSLDRGDWVPLAELTEGETLQGQTGPAIVLHLALHQAAQPVYNLEIHGEHVYQVGGLAVLVHNAAPHECAKGFGRYLRGLIGAPPKRMIDPHAHHILFKKGLGEEQQELVEMGQSILKKVGIDPVYGKENLVWAPWRVHGQHDIQALRKVVDKLQELDDLGASYEDFVDALRKLGRIAQKRGS